MFQLAVAADLVMRIHARPVFLQKRQSGIFEKIVPRKTAISIKSCRCNWQNHLKEFTKYFRDKIKSGNEVFSVRYLNGRWQGQIARASTLRHIPYF